MLFDSVPLLHVEAADWPSAGQALQALQALRSKGFQIPLTGALTGALIDALTSCCRHSTQLASTAGGQAFCAFGRDGAG